MKRRKFVKNAGLLGSVAMANLQNHLPQMKTKYKMGYQLYSIRDEMARAPIETIKSLKKMGYHDFELYGFDDAAGKYYGYKSSDLRMIMDDLGLTITSGHYGFAPYLDKPIDELKSYVDRCIEGAKIIGNDYITWPWIAPEQRTLENFKLMTSRLNIIGEQVTKAGLGFAYHNHGFEFEDHNGENGYDIIMKGTDSDLVKLQIDMYWVMHSSKLTPQEIIDKEPGRFVMWHIKDMDKISRDYTELGNGSIDYTKLLPDPDTSGLVYYYLEQGGNYAVDSTTSARDSANYFKDKLQHKI